MIGMEFIFTMFILNQKQQDKYYSAMTNKKGKSGRKPYLNPLDKKVRVEFWVKAKTIENLGGKEKAKALAVKACERNIS